MIEQEECSSLDVGVGIRITRASQHTKPGGCRMTWTKRTGQGQDLRSSKSTKERFEAALKIWPKEPQRRHSMPCRKQRVTPFAGRADMKDLRSDWIPAQDITTENSTPGQGKRLRRPPRRNWTLPNSKLT